MNPRRLVTLKLLTCIFGGAVLTPALFYALHILTSSRGIGPDRVIPVLAGIGALYGVFCGILWAYRHKMNHNGTA